jgi:hypothetical protein
VIVKVGLLGHRIGHRLFWTWPEEVHSGPIELRIYAQIGTGRTIPGPLPHIAPERITLNDHEHVGDTGRGRAGPARRGMRGLVSGQRPGTSSGGHPHRVHDRRTLAVTGGLPANGREGAACTTPTAYRDVVAGAPVVVTDHLMKTIAVGRLEPGRLVRVSGERHCVFPFAVPDVPTGQPFYRVVFADRRPRWYDEPQARAGISLTVG